MRATMIGSLIAAVPLNDYHTTETCEQKQKEIKSERWFYVLACLAMHTLPLGSFLVCAIRTHIAYFSAVHEAWKKMNGKWKSSNCGQSNDRMRASQPSVQFAGWNANSSHRHRNRCKIWCATSVAQREKYKRRRATTTIIINLPSFAFMCACAWITVWNVFWFISIA